MQSIPEAGKTPTQVKCVGKDGLQGRADSKATPVLLGIYALKAHIFTGSLSEILKVT